MQKRITLILLVTCTFFCGALHAQGWLWAKWNTGTGMDGWPVATDPFGNVFVGGFTAVGQAKFGSIIVPRAGITGLQPIIVKYDANGNVLWANGVENGESYIMNIATDQNGNSFMFGTINSSSLQIGSVTLTNTIAPTPQYFIAKYDPSGNVLWAINAGNAQGAYVGTCISVVLSTGGITTDASGNIFVTANFRLPSTTIGSFTLSNTDPSGNTDDILIAKYDPSGTLQWAKSAGGAKDDDAYGITVTPAGDIYIAGTFTSPSISIGSSILTNVNNAQEAFIARFNSSGNPVWGDNSVTVGLGGIDTCVGNAIGIASDASNNIYITGGLLSNSILFGGAAITNPASGHPYLYLMKFDPSNNVSWYKTIFSASHNFGTWGYSIAMSKCGTIWISGVMNDSVNIDGHVLHEPENSSDPVFIAGYTSTGVYNGSAALQSGGDDQNGIACDPSGNVYMCSDYATSPFIVGVDTVTSDSGGEMLYVAKYPYINAGQQNFKHSASEDCLGKGITLAAPGGFANYIWSTGLESTTYKATDTGVYWVYGYDSCASSEADTFKISAVDCDCAKSLFVPNTFTPNGDGQDDIFYPRCGTGIKLIKTFMVYNRWGEQMFERRNLMPNDASNAWDGTYKGDKPLPDVYVWVVEAVCEGGNTINKKGSITVIR